MYKTLIFLAFISVIASASVTKPVQNLSQTEKEQIFKSKFEKAYEIKEYEHFKKDFLKNFEQVSK